MGHSASAKSKSRDGAMRQAGETVHIPPAPAPATGSLPHIRQAPRGPAPSPKFCHPTSRQPKNTFLFLSTMCSKVPVTSSLSSERSLEPTPPLRRPHHLVCSPETSKLASRPESWAKPLPQSPGGQRVRASGCHARLGAGVVEAGERGAEPRTSSRAWMAKAVSQICEPLVPCTEDGVTAAAPVPSHHPTSRT